MDRLVLYQKTNVILMKMIDLIKQKNMNYFTFLGEGNDAIVYGFHQYAVKFKKDNCLSLQDAKILRKIGDIDIFPSLHAYKEGDFLIMDRIEGETLGGLGLINLEQLIFFPEIMKKSLLDGIEACFERMVVPHDLHLNNLIYQKETDELKIIDVGRFVEVEERYVQACKSSYKKECRMYRSLSVAEKVYAF